ncbi:SspB-related isopeptide-forming adhesin [Streptococcus thermophilus]|uniref:Cell surface protein n=1 Tax=Streptococcus thermophilus TaxID=1308 RepID=A0A8D6XU44_STRTR|nr:SspB-related isopeptide-forming adhesin [Streptococcus thermophilus]CAD0140103.1 Cell surface protein [Streptococcus thermophilus]CAD0146247.1 Cell surface protein [Streptococcus thermophilus]CAD0153264.1 Cell surface protein [Streptococcus thermophilus]
MTTNNTKGHGYFRKKKWAKGLVSGIALAGAVAFSSGAVLADEVTSPVTESEATTVVTQPESTNDNNAYAAQANTSTGTQPVAIDNSTVEAAVETATETGVAVTKEATVDQGTDTNSTDLDASKADIKSDQEKQVKEIKAATQTQADNNAAFSEAQGAIDANNDFVEDAKGKHEKDTTVTVTTDGSTATDGSAAKNKQATEVAKKTLKGNQESVKTYELNKATYDATVAEAKTLNQAVESAANALKDKGVTVTTTEKVVTSVAEVEALRKQNEAAIASAEKQITLNTAILAAHDKTKKASDATNADADSKVTDLKEKGVTVNVTTTVVSSAEEAETLRKQNEAAATSAGNQVASNNAILAAHDKTKKASDATNADADSKVTDLKEKGVTVNVTTTVVSSAEEAETLRKQNEAAATSAGNQVASNNAVLAAHDKTKKASDATNADADTKAKELKGKGVSVTTAEKEVSSAEEAEKITSQNKSAYDQAKQKQADWQKKYDELQSKTGTEGYTKQVVLQALDLSASNPQATHGSSAAGSQIVGTRDIGSTTGSSGYGRILDSTGVFKYANVGKGWTTEIDYTNLKGLTVTTTDGQKHDISRIHRTFQLVNTGATGLNDVYIPNDPTEGFIVARNNGTGSYSDYMNFLVTDSYYYTVNGKEVVYSASQETPIALTYSSLNNNPIGREGARATGDGSSMVEINGSTVSVHGDQFAYSDNYNRQEETGLNWDTTDSAYQYKGAAIGVFTQGSSFTTEFVQWDGPADPAGQTYWFAINTRVVAPVVKTPTSARLTKTTVKPTEVKPISASLIKTTVKPSKVEPVNVSIVKTTVDPVSPDPVSAELVKAKNPEKPTLELTKLADTKNQQVSVAYHDYKLSYKPTVTKTVTDTDKKNTDGATVAKNTPQVYTLDHDNIYANIKVGDTITIVDPLEAGATPVVAENEADAQAKGWTVNYDETQETYTYTAVYQGKKLEAPTIKWVPIYDKAFYDNTYKVFKNDYEAFSNTVTTYTPPTPDPVKSITDNSGADINGAKTFDRNVNFHLTTDYSPYTKVTASTLAIAKGFAIMDDVQDGAFTINEDGITATATDGTDVKDLFTMYHVLSDEARTEAIQAILDNANLSPVGEFYLWVAKDPASFYANYVKQAKNVTIDLPARLLVPEGEVVENDFYQIDFGNSYQSNLVTVEVPDVTPEKHALDQKDDNIILDDQTVQIGEYIRYLLDGVTVPVKHDTLWQYDGKDKLDIAHDRYTGNWKGIIKGTEYTAKEDLVLTYDVTLEDGTLVKAGDTIKSGSKYAFTFEFDQDTNNDFIKKIVTVTWDDKKGEWAYSIDEEFLRSLGVEGTFDADFYLEVERIKDGEVENTFINTINGRELVAKVTTHTPTPETPAKPEEPVKPIKEVPVKPIKEVPVVKAAALPMTGEKTTPMNVLATLIGLMMTVGAVFGLRKKEKHN